MTFDPTLDEESYATFLIEAQDILQRIEQDLLSLRTDRSPAKIHRLMRAAHTLKGAAASVDLKTIKQIAHVLEDIFKALYNPDVLVDAEVEALLFQAYECLRFPLMAEVTGQHTQTQEFLDRAASIIAQLQERWGDCFDRDAPLPNSVELGFDVVQSLFEVGVQQRLQELRQAIYSGKPQTVAAELRTKADIFAGLAESLNLPGFGWIAQVVLAALEAHPDQIQTIAELALENFVQGQTLVLNGDRTEGGRPSPALLSLAGIEPSAHTFTQATEVQFPNLDDVFGDEAFSNAAARSKALAPDPASKLISAQATESLRAKPIELSVSATSTTEPVEAQQGEPARVELVRVNVEQLKQLDYSVGELLINQSKQTTQDQQLRTTVQALRSTLHQHQQTLYNLQDCVEKLMGHLEQGTPLSATILAAVGSGAATPLTAPSLTSTFDVLEMERYHNLRVLIRSTLNQMVQLDETAETVDQITKQSRRSLETQRRLLVQVRDDVTSLRMLPLRDLLNRFPRLLQQLAEAHNKRVEFVLSDTQELVDKVVAEKLYDPLLHLIRNAFDHGIEPPAVRRAQDKAEIGKIEIRVSQQGHYTLIEVKDDGRGINFQQVAQRAVELNLVNREQVSTLSEAQLLDLIFQPGFSTASELSDLSGRGIGLDAVNSQLLAMNGSIAVNTAPHQGTTFSLKIPLSLTTTKLLVCEAEGFAYALSLDQVEQIIVPAPDQLNVSISEQLMLHWKQGKEELIVPIDRLAELIQYSAISQQLASAAHVQFTNDRQKLHDRSPAAVVLLLQTSFGRRAVMVDRVFGEQELVIRALGTAIAPPPYVYGCCILGSNRSALAIDVEVLMQQTTEVAFSSRPDPVLHPALPERLLPAKEHLIPSHQFTNHDRLLKPARSRCILVVDDSLTLRRQLTRLLEQDSYEVLQAGDGLEALAQLEKHPHVNVVICDIEMPNLNGFDFLSQVQRDPVLAKIPVVILTSRSGDKHRQIALELGATAYFTKPYNHRQFMTTINHLLEQLV